MSKQSPINFVFIFILLLPFMDFLSFFNNSCFLSLSILSKGILLIYALFYIFKNTEHRKIFLFFCIYFFIYSCYLIKENLSMEFFLTNTITIFSLPILILFFANYKKEAINKKTIFYLSLITLVLFQISYIFSISMDSLYSSYLLLFSCAFIYIKESNNYLLKVFYFLFFIIVLLLIHNFLFSLGFLFLFLYFLCQKEIRKSFKTLVTVFVLLFVLTLYIKPLNFQNKSLEGFSEISERLSSLEKVHQKFKESSALEKVLGMKEVDRKTNIDFFDIFYYLGILGMGFYIVFFFYVLNKSKLSKQYCYTFIFFFLYSYFGNILTNIYIIPYLALLFLISKNEKGIMKKNILFVSNMYPDEKNPHYGIFVKNTYEILKKDNVIDLVVIHKSERKVKKLVSYVYLCGVSFWKAIFNNYDFIYVHFISHTPIGVFFPYLCSKNTKLVLNVHGNDLVADTKTDAKYLTLSKLFLKRTDIVISPSKYFERILRKDYKIGKEKIVIYPSGGVDTNKFKKVNKKNALKNAKLDLKYKYFGYISRIEKDKGYDTFVKAIHELEKKKISKEIKFLLVGDGSEEDNLNILIKKYKLEDRIIRRPLVSQEELVSIYNSLEAFVYPTRRKSESLGLTGIEAMACEVLVIGSNKFGPSDYLIDNENSLTFDPLDFKELAEKIEQALKMSKKEKDNLTKNARLKSEEYGIEIIEKIILKVFRK